MSVFTDMASGAFNLIGTGLTEIGKGLFGKNDSPIYNAKWGSYSDHASILNQGFALRGGMSAITKEISTRNAIIIGQSGSGKSSSQLVGSICSLARGRSSMVVLDIESQAYKVTSGWLSKKGYHIYCINYQDTSDGFNFLQNVTTSEEAQSIAHSLIRNGGVQSTDHYWVASATSMASVFLEYVIRYCPPEVRSIASALRLLEIFSYDPEACDRMFVRTHPELLSSYKSIVATPEKTRLSTLSTVTTALHVFKNPAVRRITSVSTFDFEKFRSEPSILYICTPVMQTNELAPVSALLYESLFKTIFSRIPSEDELYIYPLIDELVTMRFKDLGMVYSQIRKFRGGCMGLIQSPEMLKMHFSAADCHALLSNSYARVYLPGQNLNTCLELEKTLGLQTVIENGIERTRPLIPASDVRMTDKAIIILGNHEPILTSLKPFYSHHILKGRCSLPPYPLTRKIPYDEPPLIQVI